MPRPLPFTCEKSPASGSGGMVVTNHPLGSAAGLEILAAGGNAVDAAVAALLALTVVEPMMVGIAGGGLAHIRMADGRHVVIDALSTAAASMHAAIYAPASDAPLEMQAKGRRSEIGASAVAVPGNLAGWCDMQARYGLPGGLRIFPSAMQAICNRIDHGMSLQQAVEAPRLWTQGQEVEIERGFAPQQAALEALGHEVRVMPHIGGGMNAISFAETMTGAACWRADGTVAALGGGLARAGVRFWPDKAPAEPPPDETP